LGTDWTTQLLESDQQWFVEYANTLADDFLSNAMPNITYNHSRYQSGYRHKGRSMGSTFDGDAETLTIGAFNFFPDGRNLSASVSYLDLNKDGQNRAVVIDEDVFYTVPDGNQTAAMVSVGYGTQFLNGWLDLTAQATDKKIEFISGEKDQWSVGAAWRYRF
jgi:hypothetical protein